MKKLVALVLSALMMTTALTGCGTTATQTGTTTGVVETTTAKATAGEATTAGTTAAAGATASEESVVRLGIALDPASLSPFAGRSQGLVDTYRTIYEYLIDRDSFGGELKGCIMKSYEQVDDVTYDLTIYDYIHDTAGNAITADDVVFSFEGAKAAGSLPKLNAIASVTKTGDYTVQFVFAKKLAVGELEALWSENPIISKKSFEASPDGMAKDPVGTTAYKVVEYVTGSKIVCEATGDYWQTDASLSPIAASHNVDRIEFHIITEGAQRAIALETGSIDITNGVKASDVARFADESKYNTFKYLENPLSVLYYNCAAGNPFAGNQALREAIAFAIDSQGIVDGAYNGDGTAIKSIASPKYGDYVAEMDNPDYFGYDLEKAKKLMADAGYATGGLSLKLMCLNEERIKSAATIFQAALMQLGITVEIVSMDQAMLNTTELDPSAWDLYLKTGASTDYLANVWKLYWSANNYKGHTMGFIEDAKLQELLEACLSVDTHSKETLMAFNQYVWDNCYAFGVNTYNSYVVGSTKVKKVFQDSRNAVIPGACTYSFN